MPNPADPRTPFSWAVIHEGNRYGGFANVTAARVFANGRPPSLYGPPLIVYGRWLDEGPVALAASVNDMPVQVGMIDGFRTDEAKRMRETE